jgi:CubicO group peptidase (beta-lactamase class C family)
MTTAALPRSTPEAQGIPSRAIAAFLDAAERDVEHLHSLVVARRGHVVAEGYWAPYDAATPHMLFSLSKSFTSTAIGMLVGDGKLSVEDRVLDFFPDEAPADPGPRLRAMTVRHLLTMTSGHDGDPTRPVRQANVSWARAFFDAPLVHEPGEVFVYNSGATYMCSAIAQKLTGQRLLDFLGTRLFEPLGFESPTWEQSPQGIDTGGWGLKIRTAEIARFGQLYLQRGVWQGARLIPESWIAEATSAQVPNATRGNPNLGQPDWEQGYGYQFWRCRHNAYRGDGASGQFCLVLPEQEAVIATTSGTGKLQRVLELVWEHLLPVMGPSALPVDRAAQDQLAARLNDLRLQTPVGAATSPLAAELSGRLYAVEPNENGIAAVAFEEGALVVRSEGGEQRVRVGYGEWARGELALPGFPSSAQPPSARVAAAGAWADTRTYRLHLWSYETPWLGTWTCHFDGDRLRIEREIHPLSPTTPVPTALDARSAAPVG